MSIIIHFFNGNDLEIQNHYLRKEYRNDIAIEIDSVFYEVYFFTKDALEYEMTKDGYFSLPGIIILDEITHDKIILAVSKLIDNKYFEYFKGYDKNPINNRFIQKWYDNDLGNFKSDNMCSYKLR